MPLISKISGKGISGFRNVFEMCLDLSDHGIGYVPYERYKHEGRARAVYH